MHDSLVILDVFLILTMVIVSIAFLKERQSINIYIFCLFCLIFNTADKYIIEPYGAFGYIGAALTDLLIIYILSRLIHISEITLKIQRVCKMFITVNFIGWILYMLYEPAIYYKVLCTALYFYTLIITTISGVKNVTRGGSMDWRIFSIFSNTSSRSNITETNQKEARN